MSTLAHATPSQLKWAEQHRQRLERMSPTAQVREAPPEVIALPPVEPEPTPLDAIHVPWLDKMGVERIKTEVAMHFKVTRLDLVSARRTKNIVLPRQIAMYLAKTMTLKSLPEIGRRFGGRDHTTVLHAVRKIKALESSNPHVAAAIATIKASMGIPTDA
jgi:Bacterial dnaA protein helix-turn-helix